MADQMKQYEIVFMLKAALDSSMNNFSALGGKIKELEEKVRGYQDTIGKIDSFRKQQDELQRLEQKYAKTNASLTDATQRFNDATTKVKAANQEYQSHSEKVDKLTVSIANEKAAIADISAKLKQEGADTKALSQAKAEHQAKLASLNAELVKEKQELGNSKKALEEATRAEKAAQEQKNALQKTSDQLKEKIGKERDALRTTSEALRKMGVDTTRLDEEVKRLNQDMGAAKNELERFTAIRDGITGLADQFMVMSSAARMVLPALNQINGFFKDSLNLAAELQYTMSAVEAISGASASDMTKLTAVAKQMGATSRYTALDAANALKQMALAGWEAEGMAAALPGVVNLAAAADEDLSEMTRILVDGMNAFGMSGTENARKFADVLAKSATSSSTTVLQLGRALEACQGTAGNLGYTIEDVGTVLAAMANNGIKASVAGTALNTLLTRLSGGIKDAEELMQGMGVSMYNAQGQAKPLLEFINDLRDGFKQFGDNARDAQTAAYKLAGMRGMKGLLSIINMSDEAWEKLCADVSEYAGAAEQIAGISMDNYKGQLYLLSSAWDALKTSVGEKFLPSATAALRVLTDITSGVDGFVQSHGDLVRFIAGVTVSLGGMLSALTGISVIVGILKFAFTTLGITSLAAVAGTFGVIGVAALTLGAAFASLTREMDAAREAEVKISRQLKSSAENYRRNVTAINEEESSVRSLAAQLQELAAKSNKTAVEQEWISRICDQLNEKIPELSLRYIEEADSVKGLTDSLDDYIRNIYEAKRREEDFAKAESLYAAIQNTKDAIKTAEIELAEFRSQAGKPIQTGGVMGLSLGEQKNFSLLATITRLKNQLDALQEEYDALKLKIYGVDKVQEGAEESAISFSGALKNILTTVSSLSEAYEKAHEEAVKSVTGQFQLWDKVETVGAKKPKELLDAIKEQTKYWENYNKNLSYLSGLTPEIEGLSGVLAELTSAGPTPETAARLEGMANAAKNHTGEVWNIAEAYQALSKAEADTVSATEQITLDLPGRLNQMEQDVINAIEGMKQEDLAKDSAEATVNAFINQASEMTASVESQFGSLGTSAANALEGSLERIVVKLNNVIYRAKAAENAVKTAAQSANGYAPTSGVLREQYVSNMKRDMEQKTNQYASGTNYAASGLALVGEEGPELMFMRGGERVLPAYETERILRQTDALRERRTQIINEYAALRETMRQYEPDAYRYEPATGGGALDLIPYSAPRAGNRDGGNVTVNLSVAYHVSADGGNTADLKRAFRENDGELKKLVVSAVREYQRNQRRRAYL